MTERLSVPGWLAEHARQFDQSGNPPVTPRVAATVMLLRPTMLPRPALTGFEVYVQQRAATMAFAPGLYAFPGGSVDVRDSEVDVAWGSRGPRWWATRLGLSEPDARAVVCAAVREVFEECGVLLAGTEESTVVGDVAGPEWEVDRTALLARELSLAELMATRGLTIRSDLLEPWTRWLTPEFEPRRFDTFFFVARLPQSQRPRDVGGESVGAAWLPPGEAAQLPMLPPTAHTLRQIAECESIDAVLAEAARHDLTTAIMPRVVEDAAGAWFLI